MKSSTVTKPGGLQKTAQHLRDNQTAWEYQLGRKLRTWGVRYEAQHIIGPWIADFYLPEYALVVELDGSGHFSHEGRLRDAGRDEWFRDNGYRIVHIPNLEVRDFQFSDLFESGLNGPVVVTDDGAPLFMASFLAAFPE